MKRTYIAAAALLLGTSALAWAQNEPTAPVDKDPAVATTMIIKPTVEEAITAKEARSLDQAKAVTADPEAADAGWTDASDAGVGGPVETAEVTPATAASDLALRPATHNYPPCDPGPGDDNCIQLYERGVRDQLSSWNGPMGGLADGSATTSVGGPYEAADQSDSGKPAASTSPSATGSTSTTGTGTAGTSGSSSTHAGHDMSAGSADKPQAEPTGTTQDDTTEPNQ